MSSTPELPSWVAPPEEGSAATRARFDVFKPGVIGKEVVELGKSASVTFGRNPDMADIILDHPSISRRHAGVLHDGKGGLKIYDFGSTHGTYLDGQRLVARDPVLLRDGARVKFAESSRTYVFKLPGRKEDEEGADGAAASSAETKSSGLGSMPPPAPRAPARGPAVMENSRPAARGESDAPMVLDQEALSSLPVAFGGSKKPGSAALSKDAMAAGIAEMMKEIQETEKKREKEETEGPGVDAEEEGGEDGDDDEGDGEESDDDMGPRPLPTSGSSGKAPDSSNGPAKPRGEEPVDMVTKHQVPISHETLLRGHHKAITCIAMDPAGSRIAVGGTDYKVLLYDFGGMDRTGKPFREIEPEDGHPVIAISWSSTGDRFLCVTGSSTPKIFDRDGVPLLEFVKGDPYIADMAQTKGHTMSCSGGQWHPSDRNTVMTSSFDGTVRLWDLNGKRAFTKLICKKVVKARSARNLKVSVTSATYSPSGEWVAAGCGDGSIQMFNMRKYSWIKPDVLIRPGHAADSEVTAVVFSHDGGRVASRATDNSIKIWDIKSPKAPLKVIEDVLTYFETANVAFSPDGKLLCCGMNVNKGEGSGLIRFYDAAPSSPTEPVAQMGVAPDSSVTYVLWHMRIKQIVLGTSAGVSKILYDPNFSVKGALLSSTRVKRAKDPSDLLSGGVVGEIYNPHALPMYRTEPKGKRKREKDRNDPLKSKKPEQPLNGPGFQGRISGINNFTQFVMQNTAKNTMRDEDPREAILKYAEKEKEGRLLVGKAYEKTAPQTLLLEKTLEQEIEEMKKLEAEILKK